jgi:hypothetical protein
VTNVGTPSSAIFDFVLQQGPPGATSEGGGGISIGKAIAMTIVFG